MRWNRPFRGLWPALLLGVLVGCGQNSSATLVPVSGRITLNGQPLPDATVHFKPLAAAGGEAPPDASGRTNAEGRFTLKASIKGKDAEGAPPGKYRVLISQLNRTVGAKKPGEQLPAKYNSESKLDFTVPAEGTDKANFDVKK